MTIWHVWSDGSCQHGVANVAKGVPGWGGWAAIVEHGSDGHVLRGRVPKTTNVRMELRAAAEGLRAVPAGAFCRLHTDCTTILSVYARGPFAGQRDEKCWRDLVAEFARVEVEIDLLGRGKRDPHHHRAHVIAGSEARAGLKNLPVNAVPLEDGHRLRAVQRKRQTGFRTIGQALRHSPACEPGFCLDHCPIRLADGARLPPSAARTTMQARPCV